MRKLIALTASLLVCLALASCSKGGYRVDLFIGDEKTPRATEIGTALQTKLTEAGITVETHNAAGKMDTQLEQIDEAIKAKTNLLVVHIAKADDSTNTYMIIQKAKDAGIPVIFFDREPSSTAIVESYKGYSMYVGYDMDKAAKLYADMVTVALLADWDKYDLNGDGKISYIMLRGKTGSTEATKRTTTAMTNINNILTEAEKEKLSFYDSDNSLSYVSSDGRRDLAKRFMEDALENFPFDGENPVELVLANNDELALGAIEALEAVGYNTGAQDAPSVPVFSVDGTAEGQAAVQAGKLNGTLAMDPLKIADTLADVIVRLKNGETITAYVQPIRDAQEETKDDDKAVTLNANADMLYLPYERIPEPPAAEEEEVPES